MKVQHLFGIFAALALIAFGLFFPTPAKHLDVEDRYNYSSHSYEQWKWTDNKGEEYVGGDAYNYQMEASLKAGYISGVLAMKSITVVSGILLFFTSLYSACKIESVIEQTNVLKEIYRSLTANPTTAEYGKFSPRPVSTAAAPYRTASTTGGRKVCPHCGQEQDSTNTNCIGCGEIILS